MREQRRNKRRTARRVRISVRGRLSEHLAPAFDGMALVKRRGQTDLVGEVIDQAHLYGLLARIRDLGLELESVSFVPHEAVRRPGPSVDEHEAG